MYLEEVYLFTGTEEVRNRTKMERVLSSLDMNKTSITKYDADFVNIFGFIFQTMHNIMMLITPTSILLVGGLSLLDVSIKDWFKYILMFVLQLLVLSIVISIGLVLMV
mgnify:CR=1 FL=1